MVKNRTHDQQSVCSFPTGYIARAHGQDLYVFSPDNSHRATFHGPHRALTDSDGQLVVYPETTLTCDEERLLTLQNKLKDINRKNEEFWRL